jgi:peptide/nickel transport system permease protein
VLQYLSWLSNVVQGNFGDSLIYNLSAAELIVSRIPASLVLAVSALIIATMVGIPLGVAAALREGGVVDWVVSAASALMLATPNFWFGILVILLFAVHLGWLPPGGYVPLDQGPGQALPYLLLPAVTLAFNEIAILARFTRASLLEVLNDDYIRTARAKGASSARLIVKHALRNAMIPIVTMMGILFGNAAGGVIVIETVFAWPGLGRLLVQSIGARDYPVVQGALLVLVLIFLLINLLVDLLYGALDPRIRLDAQRAVR